jgi:hypothetical protein
VATDLQILHASWSGSLNGHAFANGYLTTLGMGDSIDGNSAFEANSHPAHAGSGLTLHRGTKCPVANAKYCCRDADPGRDFKTLPVDMYRYHCA